MRIRIAVAVLAVLLPLTLRAQRIPEEVPLEDVLEIVVLKRKLLAIGARGGGQVELDLEIGERVLSTESRGRVGVALTDRRVLAVTDRSGSWQEERYLQTEKASTQVQLGDRVALITTSQRLLGFDGGSGNLIETRMGPHEKLLRTAVGSNVVVAVTDRRALGLSPSVGGFFPTPMRLGERIESVTAKADLVTVITSTRILIFRGPSGSWEERNLDLR